MGRALPPLIWTKSKTTADFFSGNRPLHEGLAHSSGTDRCSIVTLEVFEQSEHRYNHEDGHDHNHNDRD